MERRQAGVENCALLEGIRGLRDTVYPETNFPPAEYLGRSLLPRCFLAEVFPPPARKHLPGLRDSAAVTDIVYEKSFT